MNKLTIIAFDVETCLFRPGLPAPPLVCISYQTQGDVPSLVQASAAAELQILSWLKDDSVLLVGHNVAYDVAVLMETWPHHIPLWFEKYDKNLVTDSLLRQQLLDIADGVLEGDSKRDYSLGGLYELYTGIVLDKDTWRKRYGELRSVPLRDWPEGARLYPLDDAKATLAVANFQTARKHLLADQFAQARAALALHLASAWGMRTVASRIDVLEARTTLQRKELEPALRDARLVRPSGRKNAKVIRARVREAYLESGRLPPMAKQPHKRKGKAPPQIAIDYKACMGSGVPILQQYAKWSKLGALLSKSVPALRQGQKYPIHTRFWMAETGRTTSRGVNVQNFAREGGERECFTPRPGMVFLNADFDQFELRGLGQVLCEWFGSSRLAELLNAGTDPHLWFASLLLDIPFESAKERYEAGDEEITETRQTAKIALFGLPGGMSAKTFVTYAAIRGITLTLERSEWLKSKWLEAFPEMLLYFERIKSMERDGSFQVEQLYSSRVRGGMRYTSCCNTWFQGICADAAKHAMWLVTKACYAVPSSPLFGSRVIAFIHDEALLETTPDNIHAKGEELCRLMVRGANKFLFKCPARTAPKAMNMWTKKAATVRDVDGKLQIWKKPDTASVGGSQPA